MIKNGLSVGIEVQIGNNSMDFSDKKKRKITIFGFPLESERGRK